MAKTIIIKVIVFSNLFFTTCRYNSRKLYIIDVSQSVEHVHPYALDFLRKDCANVTDFFKKKHVRVMSIRQLFDFITDLSFGIEEKDMEEELDKVRVLRSHCWLLRLVSRFDCVYELILCFSLWK